MHELLKQRAELLLLGGYRPDEVTSNLSVEFDLDEFQTEDLPKLVQAVQEKTCWPHSSN